MEATYTLTSEQEATLLPLFPRLISGDEVTCDGCDTWTHIEDIFIYTGSEDYYLCPHCGWMMDEMV